MRPRPKRRIMKSKVGVVWRTCALCGSAEPSKKLLAAALERTNRAGQLSRNVYLYHKKCLTKRVDEDGAGLAIDIVGAIKQMKDLKKKRKEFHEKKGKAAAQWWKDNKDKDK